MKSDLKQYIKCICVGEPDPPGMVEWCRQCRETIKPVDIYGMTLLEIVRRFVNLHASIKSNDPPDSRTIIQETLSLESEMDKWERECPEIWIFTTKESTEPSEITYKGQEHVYRDFWTARVYNNYRWGRILINELLIVHMAQLGLCSTEDVNQREKSLEIILRLATDICSSVASQFRRHNVREARHNHVPAMSPCFFLLFPLAVAGSAIDIPDELHDWVTDMFGFIGNKMGIFQALSLIEATKAQRERWKTLDLAPSDCWRLEEFAM